MELRFFRIMLMVFVVTINTTTHITAKFVFKSKNEWKTKAPRTVNAGHVNTVHKPNSAEGVEWKIPSTRGVAKTTIFQKHLKTEKISTADISMIDTENVNTMKKERGRYIVPLSTKRTKTSVDDESGNNTKKITAGTKSQAGTNMGKDEFSTKNLSYSTVPTMNSNYSHHQDNSKLIGIIVGLTATFFLLVVIIVVVLCYYKKLLCFKRNEKCDEETPSISMLNGKNKKADDSVGEDTVLIVKVENNNTPDTTEDEVDISSAKTNSPVCVYVHASKYNNIQPTSNDENVKVLATCI